MDNGEQEAVRKEITPQRPVVICGPSGCGKSTLIRILMQKYPERFHYCISHTTRPMRSDEVDGKDYYFISREEFKRRNEDKAFIEYAIFSGDYYGTSQAELTKANETGRMCLMDIDTQGVETIQKTDLNPFCIFIRPKNFATLEKRLRARSTETEDRILQRLAVAHQEMQYGIAEGNFNVVIVNDDLHVAVNKITSILENNQVKATIDTQKDRGLIMTSFSL